MPKINTSTKSSSPAARGKRLKSLRLMADLSRHDIQDKYDISEYTLRSWEEGRHTGLTEQGAKRMLMVLKKEGIQVDIGWLLEGVGNYPIYSKW